MDYIWRFVLATGKWIRMQLTHDRPPGLLAGGCLALKNNRLAIFGNYLSGGKRGSRMTNEFHVLDLKAGRWEEMANDRSRPDPRFGSSAVWTESRMWLFGGYVKGSGRPASVDEFWVFNDANRDRLE